MRPWLLPLTLVSLWACGGEDHAPPDAGTPPEDGGPELGEDAEVPPDVDESGPLFEPDHVVQVSIELDPGDWETLRHQTRDINNLIGGEDCLGEPFVSPFTYFEADVTVDGQTIRQVGVRKKGLIGSLSETKPSLKIDFEQYVPDQALLGLGKLTLQNSVSDASYLRQCLSYELFAEAGLPAPRCNFARVEVNGQDLGLYVNLESIGKAFLRRHWDDDEGNLYEGSLSDFRPDWVGTFDPKTNEEAGDRSDLDGVIAALEADDSTVLEALDQVLDVDQFIRYWAMEVLTAHIDGYASNTNNFFVYDDPTTGRFQFFPWGTDATFYPSNPFGGPFVSVFATAALPRRLYLLPETHDRYANELFALLDEVWNEPVILAEIDRMSALVRPIAAAAETEAVEVAIEEVREFVRGRRAAIEGEMGAGSSPTWEQPLRPPPCLEYVGTTSGTFETTWGTLGTPDPFSAGDGSLDAVVEGDARETTATTGAVAGVDPQAADPTRPVVVLVGYEEDGSLLAVYFSLDPAVFAPGQVVPLALTGSSAALIAIDPTTGASTPIGYLMNGTVTFDEAATADGASVRGHFEADVIHFGWM